MNGHIDLGQAGPAGSATALAQRVRIGKKDLEHRRDIRDIDPEIMTLVQRAFLIPGEAAPKLVVFANAQPSQHAAPVSARAAEALKAQTEARVCVVDANLWGATLHRYFSLPLEPGFADAVTGGSEIDAYLHFTADERLAVMTAGRQPQSPQGLIVSEATRTRLSELRDRFDYVLVEAPPAILSSAAALGKLTDGLILVVEANQTRREAVKTIVDQLRQSGVNIVGSVLNNRRFPIPEALYRKL